MKTAKRWLFRLLPLLMVVLFFAAWEFYVVYFKVSAFILPPPDRIVTAMIRLLQQRNVFMHVEVTLVETLGGFGAAIVVGVALGTIMAKSPWIERALRPFVVATQIIPKVALAPLFILWFGFGLESKIVIAAVLSFFPIFSNTFIGVRSVDRGLREVMTTMNAGAWPIFWLLEIRAAMPFILTGMEVGIVLAIIGAVVGEFMGGSVGLGNLAILTLQEMQVDKLFAVVLLLTLIGVVLYLGVSMLRRWLTSWHEAIGADERP
jgi:NitT/TauT family transport system permease protein